MLNWKPALLRWRAVKRQVQDVKDVLAVIAGRGDVAADVTEALSTPFSTETAEDLLLQLDHAGIAFRQVVVKRHFTIVKKGEHSSFVAVQTVQV